MSDYDDLIADDGLGQVISAAKKKNEIQNSRNHDFTDDDLKLVNMGIKVPAYLRDEWMIAARRKKTKISAIIRAALIAELGVPDGCEDLL